MKKRILATILSICMIISLFPASAFAVENEQFAEEVSEVMLLADGDGGQTDLGEEGRRSLYVIGEPTNGGTYTLEFDGAADWTNGTPVVAGTQVKFNISPATGYEVVSVQYAVQGQGRVTIKADDDGKYTLPMPNAMTIVFVTFEMIDYTISATATPTEGGSVKVTNAEGTEIPQANYGDTVTIEATPNENYVVSSVSYTAGSAAPVTLTANADGKYTFTMPADNVAVNVAFERIYTITVTKPIEGATVTVTPTDATEGTEVTVTALPPQGSYTIVGVNYSYKDSADSTKTEAATKGQNDYTYTFEMPAADVTVTAEFEGLPFPVNFNADVLNSDSVKVGSIAVATLDADGQLKAGKTGTITLTPEENYIVDEVKVTDKDGQVLTDVTDITNSTATGNVKTYTFTMPAQVVYVNATFRKPELTVKITDNPTATNATSVTVTSDSNTVTEKSTNTEASSKTYEVSASKDVKLTINFGNDGNGTDYELSKLLVDTVDVTTDFNSTDNTYTIAADKVTKNINVEVITARKYSLSTEVDSSSSTGGTVTITTPSGTPTQVLAGTEIVITTAPTEGWQVKETDGVKVVNTTDGSVISSVTVEPFKDENGTVVENKYTFTMPAQDAKVNVAFEKIPLEVLFAYTDGTNPITFNATDSTKDALSVSGATGDNNKPVVGDNLTITAKKYVKADNGNWYILQTLKNGNTELSLTDGADATKTTSLAMPSTSVTLTATYTQAKVEVEKAGTKTYYTTISDALAEVQSSTAGGTIKLLDSIELGTQTLSFTASGTYKLDLNGKDLTRTATSNYTISTQAGVDLTIASSTAGGSITNGSTTIQAGQGATITIGETANDNFMIDTNATSEASVVKVEETGILVVNGGIIESMDPTPASVNSRSIQSFGTTTINGGTFNGTVQVWTWEDNRSELTINGGIFNDSVVVCSTENNPGTSGGYKFGGTLTINGGTFEDNPNNEDLTFVGLWVPKWANIEEYKDKVNVTIQGGTFELGENEAGEKQIGILQLAEGRGKTVPNPETPVFIIGQGQDEQGAKTSPTFKARPDDSYIDTGLAASLTQTDGKYGLVPGYEVSVNYVAKETDDDGNVTNPSDASNYEVTLSAGTLEPVTTGSIKVPSNTTVTMAIKPDEGYELGTVKVGNDTQTNPEPNAKGEYVYTIPGVTGTTDIAVEVTCTAIDYTITEADVKDPDDETKTIGTVKVTEVNGADPETAGTPAKPIANAGNIVTLTVAPAIGKQLKKDSLKVSYTENSTEKTVPLTQNASNTNVYTFTMPAADVTVTAEFEAASYVLKVDEKQIGNTGTAEDIPDGTTYGNVSIKINEGDALTDFENLPAIEKDNKLSVAVDNVAVGYRVKSVNIKTTVYSNIMGQIIKVPVDRNLELADNWYSILMENDVLKQTTPGTPDITITVTYEKIPYTITTSATKNGEADTSGTSVTFEVLDSDDNPVLDSENNPVKTATIGQKVKFTVTKPSDYKIGSMTFTVTDTDGTTILKNVTVAETDLTAGVYTVTLGETSTTNPDWVLGNLKFSAEFVTEKTVTANLGAGSATIKIGNADPVTLDTNTASAAIPFDTPVTIAITPVDDSSVKAVTGLPAGTTGTLTGNNFTFNMPATDVTLTVTYMTPVTLTRTDTVTTEPGTVDVKFTENGDTNEQDALEANNVYTVAQGSEVKIIVTPNAGYELNELAYNNQTYDSSTTGKSEFSIDTTTGVATLTISNYAGTDGSNTFSVTFKAKAQPITLTAGANGEVKFSDNVDKSSSGGVDSYTAPTDAEVTITAKPNQGFELDGTITVKDSSGNAVTLTPVATTDGSTQGKFTMPVGGVSVTVSFKAKTYRIDVDKIENGLATVKVGSDGTGDSTAVITNTPVTITATPHAGYVLGENSVKISYDAEIEVGDTLTTITAIRTLTANEDGEYIFNMPGSDVKVIVTFEKETYAADTVAVVTAADNTVKTYTDIDLAFAEATDNSTITLWGDETITAKAVLTVNKAITLDLNGKTLTKTHQSYTISVSNGGVLTIKDSSANVSTASLARSTGGTGVVANNATDGQSTTLQAGNNGKLIIKSGTIQNGLTPNCSAIKVEELGTLVINGGTIENSSSGGVNNRSIQSFGTTTINGGIIEGVVQVWQWKENGTLYPSKLTIENGTFNDSVIVCSAETANNTKYQFGGELVINGGTFNNNTTGDAMVGVRIPDWDDKLEANTQAPKMTITGGTFEVKKVGVYDNATTTYVDDSTYLVAEGGTFTATNKPIFNDIAEGMVAVEEDGKYVIKEAVAQIVKNNEDKTTVNYATINQAFDAVANGDTIKLLNDTTAEDQLTVTSMTVTLDLNGHTLTKTHSKYTVSVGGDKGDLTIIDSEGTGAIANGADNTSTTLQANNGGKLTINGGTIKNGLQPQCSAIKVEELGELVINGGIIKKSSMPGVNARSIQTFGKSTITGGTIEGVVQVWQYNTGTTPEEAYESTLNITGGTFQDSVIICGSTKPTLDYPFGGTVNITGGTFTGVNNEDGNPMVGVRLPSKLAEEGAINNHPTMNIKGGTFDVRTGVYDVAANDYLAEDSDYLTVTNGSFSTKPDNVPDGWEVVPDGDRWTIKEKDPEAPEKFTITPDSTITNGTINVIPTESIAGETVTVFVEANEGFTIGTVTVTDAEDNEQSVTKVTTSMYTFTMPASNVTVSATFEKIPDIIDTYDIIVLDTAGADVKVTDSEGTEIAQAAKDATVTITVTVDTANYTLNGIKVTDADGNPVLPEDKDGTYTFTMPASYVLVKADVEAVTPGEITYSITTESDDNGDVKVLPEKAKYKEGDLVAIIATPDEGYKLGEITCINADGEPVTVTENTFTMPASNVTVTVTFTKVEETPYDIFVVASNAAVEVTPSRKAVAGTKVTVTVTANEGYTLKNLTVTPEIEDFEFEGNTCTFTMPEGPVAVSAVVEADEPTTETEYNITKASVTNGQLVIDAEKATAGTTITVVALPNANYELDGDVTVTDKDGNSVTVTESTTSGMYTFTMPESNVTVSATFTEVAKPEYKVTILESANGTVTAETAEDGKVTLTVTPDNGYELDQLAVFNLTTGEEITVTSDNKFDMPESDVVVSATFKLKATEPDDPTGKVAVEAGTPDASGNVNITISNVKSDKFYTVRVANSEGMDKESVIFVLSGKMADPDTHTLTFQVKAGNKFIMVAETAEQPILGKDNPFADEKAVVVETTISDTKAN